MLRRALTRWCRRVAGLLSIAAVRLDPDRRPEDPHAEHLGEHLTYPPN